MVGESGISTFFLCIRCMYYAIVCGCAVQYLLFFYILLLGKQDYPVLGSDWDYCTII